MAKQRIVVKIGSSSLTNNSGFLSLEKLEEHANALAALKKEGHEVILISSGAVAAGFSRLGYPVRPTKIAGKQASAAVGQGLLIQGYTAALQKHNLVVAQLLLSRNDFINQDQYRNAYATISELLKRKTIPIINENDSTSITELTFGDNDMLSSLVSGLIHADYLIILTDINGLYDQNPTNNKNAKKYDYLPTITDKLISEAQSTTSKVGTGGMKSKIEAARTACSLGVANIFIGIGNGEQKLLDILKGKGDGTYIGAKDNKLIKNNKQWIAFHSNVKGRIVIDDGALSALIEDRRSLLPVGIKEVHGDFIKGDVVEVLSQAGNLVGKGKINFCTLQLKSIKGKSSLEIKETTLNSTIEAIHRDDWFTFS